MGVPPPAKRHQPNVPLPETILPDELIPEVLSWLTVKSLMQLRCVCKSFNTLISDPTFIRLHCKRSARNPLFALPAVHKDICVKIIPVSNLLDTSSDITLPNDPSYQLDGKDCHWIIGSCNGLISMLGYSPTCDSRDKWLHFWNPATRKISERLGCFRDYGNQILFFEKKYLPSRFTYAFGYDNSTDTYKVVALSLGYDENTQLRTNVRVFNLGDNVWRDIQSLSVVPHRFKQPVDNHGVYLSSNNCLNWLALRGGTVNAFSMEDCNVDQFLIISLDLETETYTQFPPPLSFEPNEPNICMLRDYLCFSHDSKKTHFVIWQLKEFGVEESWTQLLRIPYQNIFEHSFKWFPLHLYENSDTLILTNNGMKAMLYNLRDDRAEIIRMTDATWWLFAKVYVESLVLTY